MKLYFFIFFEICNGLGNANIRIGYSTQEPHCDLIPTFPESKSSNCVTSKAYINDSSCKTVCNNEIISTCSCLRSFGGISKFELSFSKNINNNIYLLYNINNIYLKFSVLTSLGIRWTNAHSDFQNSYKIISNRFRVIKTSEVMRSNQMRPLFSISFYINFS